MQEPGRYVLGGNPSRTSSPEDTADYDSERFVVGRSGTLYRAKGRASRQATLPVRRRTPRLPLRTRHLFRFKNEPPRSGEAQRLKSWEEPSSNAVKAA